MKIIFNHKQIDFKPTKIIAVAKNYHAHAKEMGGSAPTEPKFFLKPPSSLIGNEGAIILPHQSRRVDYEVELAVVISKSCKNIRELDAKNYIMGYSIIIDVTARDIQDAAKKDGMPWAIAKGFDTFAPFGPQIVEPTKLNPSGLDIWLKQNGVLKQKGSTKNMIFNVYQLISYVSQIMTLEPMDIIATGTPEGVGPVSSGDIIEAGIDGIGAMKIFVR